MNCPIADEQDRIGSGLGDGCADRKWFEHWSHTILFSQQNLYQRNAGPRTFIKREGAYLFDRCAAEEFHTQHRSLTANTGIGNDGIIRSVQEFDRRNQRHIHPTGSECVG